MRGRALLAGTAVLACGGGVAGCGGGGGSDAAQRFAHQADGICLSASRATVPAIADPKRQIQISLDEVARLRTVEPPASRRAAYSEFVELRARRVAVRQGVGKAIDTNDHAAYYGLRREYVALLPRVYAAAARAGLEACAGKLPAGDRRAIVALVRREETHPQAGDCRASLTPRFVAAQFGGLAGCRRELPRSASAAVHVATPQGTLPIATAVVAESGGTAPTRSQDFTLIRSGAGWRIDSIKPRRTGGLTP